MHKQHENNQVNHRWPKSGSRPFQISTASCFCPFSCISGSKYDDDDLRLYKEINAFQPSLESGLASSSYLHRRDYIWSGWQFFLRPTATVIPTPKIMMMTNYISSKWPQDITKYDDPPFLMLWWKAHQDVLFLHIRERKTSSSSSWWRQTGGPGKWSCRRGKTWWRHRHHQAWLKCKGMTSPSCFAKIRR